MRRGNKDCWERGLPPYQGGGKIYMCCQCCAWETPLARTSEAKCRGLLLSQHEPEQRPAFHESPASPSPAFLDPPVPIPVPIPIPSHRSSGPGPSPAQTGRSRLWWAEGAWKGAHGAQYSKGGGNRAPAFPKLPGKEKPYSSSFWRDLKQSLSKEMTLPHKC